MNRLTQQEALNLAAQKVQTLISEEGVALQLDEKSTETLPNGWVFFYNSAEFLKTGNISQALAGNAPIFVNKDGSLHLLSTEVSWKEAVRSL